MQTKSLYLIFGFATFLVAIAAFIVGRFMIQHTGSSNKDLPMDVAEESVFVNVNPAPELPTTHPELTGLFVQRQDNTIIVSSISLPAGGVYWAGAGLPEDDESGPEVEIVIVSETLIYRETTDFNSSPSSGTQIVQQTVGAGTLDYLHQGSFVSVWGRKSGDRIIAEILFYSNPVENQQPEPEPS